MLLKLGVLKSVADPADKMFSPIKGVRSGSMINMERRSCDDVEELDRKEAPKLKDPVGYARRLLLQAYLKGGSTYVPKLSKADDPVLAAAEKLLLKTDVIKRKCSEKRSYWSTAKKSNRLLSTLNINNVAFSLSKR